jgi:hypothetical protein
MTQPQSQFMLNRGQALVKSVKVKEYKELII